MREKDSTSPQWWRVSQVCVHIQLLEMTTLENEGKQRLAFLCPSRGLIGFRPAFATLTRGSGLMHRAFHEYGAFRGHMDRVRKGVLISMAGARWTWAVGVTQFHRQKLMS